MYSMPIDRPSWISERQTSTGSAGGVLPRVDSGRELSDDAFLSNNQDLGLRPSTSSHDEEEGGGVGEGDVWNFGSFPATSSSLSLSSNEDAAASLDHHPFQRSHNDTFNDKPLPPDVSLPPPPPPPMSISPRSPWKSPLKLRRARNREKEPIAPSVVSERKIRAVVYDTEDHLGVLTQMHGSVWQKVLPYCVVNVIITLVVYYLRHFKAIDLTFSDKGHTFMSLMVSFLVVTRSNIAYSRFMEARDNLTIVMKSCREIVQHAITFSRYESNIRAKQWRAEVARRTVVVLRTVVSVLEYQTKGQHAWKIPELTRDEKQALLTSVGRSNERSVMVLTMFLRSTIGSHVEFLESPMHVNKELRLLAFVSQLVTAYHDLMKLVTTPFPFPLVQMARTFLFVWIFTLPCALVNDIAKLPALMMLVFFITFGFIGLEFVSIEMDDPFGDDPNDFDVLGFAKVVFEDIYISLYDIDGKEAADALRKGIEAPLEELTKKAVQDHGHKRYCSVDAWRFSATGPKEKVGTDRSVLLGHSHEQSPVSSSKNFGSYGGARESKGGGDPSAGGLDLGAVFQGMKNDALEGAAGLPRPPRPPRLPRTISK